MEPDTETPAAEKPRDVGNNPAAGETPSPGVIEARAAGEIERSAAAKFQQGMIDIQSERRDEATQARALASENRDAEDWGRDRQEHHTGGHQT